MSELEEGEYLSRSPLVVEMLPLTPPSAKKKKKKLGLATWQIPIFSQLTLLSCLELI